MGQLYFKRMEVPNKGPKQHTIIKRDAKLKEKEEIQRQRQSYQGVINNVYEVTIIEKAIRCLHGAAVFPTTTTWLKLIRAAN